MPTCSEAIHQDPAAGAIAMSSKTDKITQRTSLKWVAFFDAVRPAAAQKQNPHIAPLGTVVRAPEAPTFEQHPPLCPNAKRQGDLVFETRLYHFKMIWVI